MQNLVSIIIPAYNMGDLVKSCINSVLNQTYSNYEIIIVNDGSKDNTEAVCAEFAKANVIKELLPILDICKKKGIKVISITENMESELALGADVVLKQYVNRETDKYNSQGTTSSTALCMIFHALQTALIEETGYKNEQFAVIHPGGAVGERLNNK